MRSNQSVIARQFVSETHDHKPDAPARAAPKPLTKEELMARLSAKFKVRS
jgi:hypothetical protein